MRQGKIRDHLPQTSTMKILGALLAGGNSTRFGSDKALAVLDGKPLIAHCAAALAAQCDGVVLVGRELAGFETVPDRPAPHMGPLGGLAGAMAYGDKAGFDHVLSVGVDAPYLPSDLLATLLPAPAYVSGQPVIGLWPVSALGILDEILASDGRRSVLHFIERLGARAVVLQTQPPNINTRADLEALKPPRT
jgi:molybdopterin-guanine dinucleotide biosynthesis protein A